MIGRYLPRHLAQSVETALNKVTMAQEIRLRAGKPIVLVNGEGEHFVGADGHILRTMEGALTVSSDDLGEIVSLLASNSVYAAKEDIKKGFITIDGGHRAGLCGKGVVVDGVLENIKEFSGVNIRIAREILGCADKIVEKTVQNSLIISPPGCGKTTILRDFARRISDMGHNVCIVDERSEISPMKNGAPIFDVGKRTDVMADCPKAIGMMMVLRTMNPDVIVTDEIATCEDADAIAELSCAGIKLIASMHGSSYRDFEERANFLRLKEQKIFKRVIILSKKNGVGTIESVENIL